MAGQPPQPLPDYTHGFSGRREDRGAQVNQGLGSTQLHRQWRWRERVNWGHEMKGIADFLVARAEKEELSSADPGRSWMTLYTADL